MLTNNNYVNVLYVIEIIGNFIVDFFLFRKYIRVLVGIDVFFTISFCYCYFENKVEGRSGWVIYFFIWVLLMGFWFLLIYI